MLAERRLEHMSVLYETGRWRRYFTEERFLNIIRETTEAVERWRQLAPERATAAPRPDARRPSRPSLAHSRRRRRLRSSSARSPDGAAQRTRFEPIASCANFAAPCTVRSPVIRL